MSVAPEILLSAYRHGITRNSILHAYRNPISVYFMDEGVVMLVGADVSGLLLEIGIRSHNRSPVIVHAMKARRKFLW